MAKPRTRLPRGDAEARYIRAGELEVFRQLQRDGLALDESLARNQAFAIGPFARLRADVMVDELGKTRGAINNLWGSQEGFRAAVMSVFLNDTSFGLAEVEYPDPAASDSIDAWVEALARVEIARGPHHGMTPENRYGLRWAAWLGLAPYGIWSQQVAKSSLDEYQGGVERFATQVLEPALQHFDLEIAKPRTVSDLAIAMCSTVEGFWLNACLTVGDPLGRPGSIGAALATSLNLLVRGATID